MCVCIYIYICACVYAYIYIYMYICICIHTHTHTHRGFPGGSVVNNLPTINTVGLVPDHLNKVNITVK